MTEREVTQLIKLLTKFRDSKELNEGIVLQPRDSRLYSVIGLVLLWVKWFGRDELNMDL
jgi:hypothetical protein